MPPAHERYERFASAGVAAECVGSVWRACRRRMTGVLRGGERRVERSGAPVRDWIPFVVGEWSDHPFHPEVNQEHLARLPRYVDEFAGQIMCMFTK
jgi:hypothetical protein